MSIADRIREMSDEELAEFLVYETPDECDKCHDIESGCAYHCPRERRIERMLEIITGEM